MANTKQAAKRARQGEKHRVNNKWQVSRMHTHLKRVITAIASGNAADAQTEYRLAISLTDRLVTKGLIHKNKASRHKSRLQKQITALTATA